MSTKDAVVSVYEAVMVLFIIGLYVILGWGLHSTFGGCVR